MKCLYCYNSSIKAIASAAINTTAINATAAKAATVVIMLFSVG